QGRDNHLQYGKIEGIKSVVKTELGIGFTEIRAVDKQQHGAPRALHHKARNQADDDRQNLQEGADRLFNSLAVLIDRRVQIPQVHVVWSTAPHEKACEPDHETSDYRSHHGKYYAR